MRGRWWLHVAAVDYDFVAFDIWAQIHVFARLMRINICRLVRCLGGGSFRSYVYQQDRSGL